MSLLETIRNDSLAARKDRTDRIKISLLVTLLGEVVKVGKDLGNRDTTDAEAQAVVKKFIKNLQEVCKYGSTAQKSVAELELHVLSAYLPKQMTTEELNNVVAQMLVIGPTNLGQVMKHLKTNYDGLYDGAQAKAVYTSLTT